MPSRDAEDAFHHLATFAAAVQAADVRDAIVELTVDGCVRAVGAAGLLLLRSPAADTLELVAASDATDPALDALRDIRSAFWGVVIGRGGLRWDVPEDGPSEIVALAGFDRGAVLRSASPAGDIWVLVVGAPTPLSDADVALLQALLDCAALGLDRAAAGARIGRARQVISRVADLAGTLGAAMSPEALLKGVADGLRALDGVVGVVAWGAGAGGDPHMLVESLAEGWEWDDKPTQRRLRRMLDPRTPPSIAGLIGVPVASSAKGAWISLIPLPVDPPVVMGLLQTQQEDRLAHNVFASLAGAVGPALREVRAASERRSLLASFVEGLRPREMPAWLDVGVEYHPNTGGEELFGGDFYDVLTVGEDRAVLVIGDVTGKGVPAASAAGALVWSLRAFGSRGARPGTIASLLDGLVSQSLDDERFVTMAIAEVDASTWSARLLLAGHPPPLLLRADGTAEALRLKAGPPLGVIPGEAITDPVELSLDPGDALILYTDGIIEAPVAHGSRLGVEALVDAARRLGPSATSSAVLAERLWTTVTTLLDGAPDDDCALLVVRRRPT